MKIGFIILCRYNSSRLPGKILRQINDKPILQYIIERLSQVVPIENIVVATSEEATDDKIEEYCVNNDINCYRGSLDNVSKRFLNCAIENSFDYATRINGDNIFVDINSVKEMVNTLGNSKAKFITNLKNRTFPRGMSVEIVETQYYQMRYNDFATEADFEHVTINLYNNEDAEKYLYFYNSKCPEASNIQLAIDTEEDFNLASQIINSFEEDHTKYGLTEIYNSYKKFKT